jgi:molybdopterin converting factor small subunit
MPRIKFTAHLQRFFPDLQNNITIEGHTVAEVIAALNTRYPGFADYVMDEKGSLRRHVNIFIGEDMMEDRQALGDRVGENDQVFIFQALSGG